jgi:hypothetical protein
MMTSYELHVLLRDVMAKEGFVKQGPTWVSSTDELLWIVQLGRSPYGERFSLDIGVAPLRITTNAALARPSDCPILMHLENLSLTLPSQVQDTRFSDFRSAAIVGFDLTREMDAEKRRQLVTSIIEALSNYIKSIVNERDLRDRYEAGDFKSALIRKDVKQLLALG